MILFSLSLCSLATEEVCVFVEKIKMSACQEKARIIVATSQADGAVCGISKPSKTNCIFLIES